MATLNPNIGNMYFYRNGQGGVSHVLGYESGTARVARVAFTTPAQGASSYNLKMCFPSGNGYSSSQTIAYYITTSSSSHSGITGSNYSSYAKDGTGHITWQGGGSPNYYGMSTGTINKTLQGGTTYYLWLFPWGTTYSWWEVRGYDDRGNMPYGIQINLSGACGSVRIYVNGTWKRAIPYVYNGGWKQAIPYIYNGGWKICGG